MIRERDMDGLPPMPESAHPDDGPEQATSETARDLKPFYCAANPSAKAVLFVNAGASWRDLWEEADARTDYVRELADALGCITGDDSVRGMVAFANVVHHLMSEARRLHHLAYDGAIRETTDKEGDA